MRGFRRDRIVLVLAAVLVATTACATVVDGTAQPDPSAAARLDTGGYPTAPRAVPARTDPNDQRVQAGYELSGALVSPAELDAAFTFSAPASTPVLPSPESLGLVFGIPLVAALSQTNTYVGGAVSARQTTLVERETADTARMMTAVIRYRSADRAAAATQAVSTETSSPASLPARPAAVPGAALPRRSLTRVWWMPFQDYLLMIGVGNVPDSRADALAATWFDRQTAALRAITATPEQLLSLPPDRDGIMSLTLPNVIRTSDGAQLALGYLTPRAWANAAADDWMATWALLERAGVDLVGTAESAVTRTRGAASARYLADAYWSGEASGTLGTEEPKVAGVPDGRCLSFITRSNGEPRKAFSCSFASGRYYVRTGAVSTLAQAHQQAAASYLMVKNAK
ncbi:DUF7373 family lipoprotein [Tsukamurella paurometabola]|nr:hypothetical protein [Tsukamurella paurometabola]UEA81168.1 hypothetical protein LK411_12135 [Tsukamurella paurometabola]